MDPSLTRHYSLYENADNMAIGSTSSFSNLASKASSRMGSPAVSSSALGADSRLARKPEQIALRQNSVGASWGTKSDQSAGMDAYSTSFGTFPALPGSSQDTFQNVDNASLAYSAFNGSQLNSQLSGLYGGQLSDQCNSQYNKLYRNQYGGQFHGQYGNEYALPCGAQYNQYSNQLGTHLGTQIGSQIGGQVAGQYGGIYSANNQPGQFMLGNQVGRSGGSSSVTSSQWEGDQEIRAGFQAFNRTGGAPTVPSSTTASTVASPDLNSDQDAVISPGNIYWNYIDLQGQMQGPFDGVQMHEWHSYMMDSTLVRRVNDAIFVSLGLLKEVTNMNEPFIILLSAKGWASVMQRTSELMISQQHKVSDDVAQTPDKEAPHTNKLPCSSQAVEATKGISAGQINPTSRESLLVPGDNVVLSLANLELNEKEAVCDPATIAASRAAAKAAELVTNLSANQPPAQIKAQMALNQPSQADSHFDAAQPAAAQAALSPKAQSQKIFEPISRRDAKVVDPAAVYPTVSSSQRPEPAVKGRSEPARTPASEPWKKASSPSSQFSIAELRQQELEKQQQLQQKKKAVEAPIAMPRKTAQARWMPIDHTQQAASVTSSLPVPAWTKKVSSPARSLAEIQKEQASKVKDVLNMEAATISGPVMASRPTSRTMAAPQARLASDAHVRPPVKSRVNPTDDVFKRANDLVEKSRSQRPSGQTHLITPNASKARVTDELVHWARVCFKDLNKGVDATELLGIFLSLPSNNSAKEFIAESIFGYSKSLDGRRFASEFVTRKKAAEKTMAPGETWQAVLNRFNPNASSVEQNPSFKVVTKKRTAKIARPGDSMHL